MSESFEWRKRAFDMVSEITKQVLTLAVGIIAVSITFFKDFATAASEGAKLIMGLSWILYTISILFGFLTLMASAGLQQEEASSTATPHHTTATIYSANIRALGALQLVSFLIGIILTVVAGFMALG